MFKKLKNKLLRLFGRAEQKAKDVKKKGKK